MSELNRSSQIALPLTFDNQFSVDNFYAKDADFISQTIRTFIEGSGESLIGLWGGQDCGKTHLLNACARLAGQQGISFQLFNAEQLCDVEPAFFSDLAEDSLVGVDNIDLIAGHKGWEEKFYQLVNLAKNSHLRFMFTMTRKPQAVSFKLPDLKSRLLWGLLIHLPTATEEELKEILQYRAQKLGLQLGPDVIFYVLQHYSRRLSDLMELLSKLDRVSLSTQRKITIPLLKAYC
jgi:DnaA family protein